MKKQLITTEDGSHTLFIPELDEHYHSTHGAINESMHIYIENGLLQCEKKKITVFEIGFGTGLNAYLTYCIGEKNGLSVQYVSIEKYPLKETEYRELNYPQQIFPENQDIFFELHKAEWNKPVTISKNFWLNKIEGDLLTYDFHNFEPVDLVYYDAFAPGKQAEMWSDEILHKVGSFVKEGGIITTYCAKGTVRRALSDSGFKMERIPGPKGKKEILRGIKEAGSDNCA